jgi:hypothetical protein
VLDVRRVVTVMGVMSCNWNNNERTLMQNLEPSTTKPEECDQRVGGDHRAMLVPTDPTSPLDVKLGLGSDWPTADYPRPAVLSEDAPFIWNEDAPQALNFMALGRRLAKVGDLYRNPQHGGGLLLASPCPAITPTPIVKGSQLAPIIVDRFLVGVIKKGKPAGSQIPTRQLDVMLASEVFLQQFPPLDAVVKTPMYLADFSLTRPGYNDGGPGQRILYVGAPAEIRRQSSAIKRFLDVMEFATAADRTNAVAAALTVMLRNFWPGAKPMFSATSTKSHGGKDTLISFACGRTPHVSISYQATDWAVEKNLAAVLQSNPDTGVVVIENARLGQREHQIQSACLERFLTDPSPVIHNTGSGDPRPRKNDVVLATSTNFGQLSTDLLNRGLRSHLAPVGDVASRKSPIGNPKLEYLPAHREQIEAELRGMIENWRDAGMPLDEDVRHPFTDWARTIGGILKVNGFEGFLTNYAQCLTELDPLRHAIGLLGALCPDEWLPAHEWAARAEQHGVSKRIIRQVDQENSVSRARGIGVVFSAHEEETFTQDTDTETIVVRLQKRRGRFGDGRVSVRYRFETVDRQPFPIDSPEDVGDDEGSSTDTAG